MDTEINTETNTSEKLKHYRHIHSLSQEGLAEISGISIRTIQRIEKGESIGSSYTIKALANALQIRPADLIPKELTVTSSSQFNVSKLKLLNLSAISIIIIPLANIIFPAIIFWKNKSDEQLNKEGRKILSFQILWTLCTLVIMAIIPLGLLSFQEFRGRSIPLFIPVYFICVGVNIYFIIRFAICINSHIPFLKKFPDIL